MSTVGCFRALVRMIAENRANVSQLDRLIRQAHAVNIDFRDTARRRLQNRIHPLLRDIEHGHRLLEGIDPHAAETPVRADDLLHALGRRLASAHDGVVAVGHALERASASDFDQRFALDIRVAVRQALDDCVPLVTELASIFAQAPKRDTLSSRQARRPSVWVSLKIVNLAGCLLPWEARQRYLDEYASELHDLAQAEDHSRLGQVTYALRLLIRTPALIFALRASVPQRQTPATSGLPDVIAVQPDD